MGYETVSSFTRTLYNEAKMGAYYTSLDHCRDIFKILRFPEDKEVSVLEPSMGDGSAVIAVTGADRNPHIKIFGVELNDGVAAKAKENPYITEVLAADFTLGVTIQRNAFSFCFANPPYLTDKDEESRLRTEREFFDRILNYLKVDGVLVYVIPYAQFQARPFLRSWLSSMETEALYKFREPEYSKYHQIVVIGRKKAKREIPLLGEIDRFTREWSLDDLPELPSEPEVTIPVGESKEENIKIFTSSEFDSAQAYNIIGLSLPDDVKEVADRRLSQKKVTFSSLPRPPIPPKKSTKFLLTTSGFGDGFVGSEETEDLHLMRGVAQVVEHSQCVSSEDDDWEDVGSSSKDKIVVTSSTESELRIVEANGRITLLK